MPKAEWLECRKKLRVWEMNVLRFSSGAVRGTGGETADGQARPKGAAAGGGAARRPERDARECRPGLSEHRSWRPASGGRRIKPAGHEIGGGFLGLSGAGRALRLPGGRGPPRWPNGGGRAFGQPRAVAELVLLVWRFRFLCPHARNSVVLSPRPCSAAAPLAEGSLCPRNS